MAAAAAGDGAGDRATAGSPPRRVALDERLLGMPEEYNELGNELARSNYIKDKCRLNDKLWEHAEVQSKKGANVRWKCIACGNVFTGGPARIRGHHIDSIGGISTCTATGDARDAAKAAAEDSLAQEMRKKKLADDKKRRREQAAEQKKAESAKKQGRISSSRGSLDKQEVDEAWAHAVYAAPMSMRLLDNPFVKEAIKKTSQLYLPEGVKKNPETMPAYEPPSRYQLGAPLLRATISSSTADLAEAQKTEAKLFGISATSDGWSSNPQHRPIEAQLFETPTVTTMNAARDFSGTVKSKANVARALGEWCDEGCARLELPKSTVDFMCVDGAEIGTVNFLMSGGKEGDVTVAPRPWQSGGGCTPHSLDLELEDIAKLGWVSDVLNEVPICSCLLARARARAARAVRAGCTRRARAHKCVCTGRARGVHA